MKDTRRQLIEHCWIEIARRHPNQYLALNRHRDHAIQGITDLTLMAQKLPDNTLKDIFNHTNISNLIEAILDENELRDSTDNGARRIQLASRLVEIGIKACIDQYQSKIEQDSVLNELTINHLLRARDICNAISFKARLPHLEKEAGKYLFNWNRIEEIHEKKVSELKDGDTKIFIRLVGDIYYNGYVHCPPDVINTLSFDQTQDDPNSNILFDFTDFYGGQCHGGISLNFEKKTAHLSMHTEDKRILQHEFVIKMENENIYVHKKRERAL